MKWLFIFLIGLSLISLASAFQGGNGSINNPYQIGNWTDLSQVSSANYILVNNLTSSTAGWNGIGNNWVPIDLNFLQGYNFNGNGYWIKNLTINVASGSYAGLFGYFYNGTIDGVNIEIDSLNCTVSNCYTGGLAGYASFGLIQNSSVTIDGKFYGAGFTGGMVGYQSANNQIKSSLVTIRSTASFSSPSYLGSFIGIMYGNVSNCGAIVNANITSGNAGGMTGDLASGAIMNNSYIIGTGQVVDSFGGGGITDTLEGKIINSYASFKAKKGIINSKSGSGGCTNSYYDTSKISSDACGAGNSTGLTALQMITQSSYVGWNISQYNTIYNSGYPFLSWQVGGTASTWYINEAPVILSIQYPTAINYPTNVSQFNITYSNARGDSSTCWYSNNNGVTNTTTNCTNGANSFNLNQTGLGTNTFTLWANTSANQITTASVTFGQYNFPAGDGSSGNPFTINSWTMLNQTRLFLSYAYSLTSSLSSLSSDYTGIGNGWLPISSFTGIFNGNSNTIGNLIVSTTATGGGLFGTLNSGNFSNLGVINANITSTTTTSGILMGQLSAGGNIVNCYSTGNITGAGTIGGLVGTNAGTVNISYSTATVKSTATITGGLVGTNTNIIIDSYATGNVSSTNTFTGGLVGSTQTQYINRSYATGFVTSTGTTTGGFAGRTFTSGKIYNSYSTGNVNGSSIVGGFIGQNAGSTLGVLTNDYSTGLVTNNTATSIGGFMGVQTSGTITGTSYWDNQTSGKPTSAGGANIIGLLTVQMKNKGNYTSWNIIGNCNNLNNNYPYLGFQITNSTSIWFMWDGTTCPVIANCWTKVNGLVTIPNSCGLFDISSLFGMGGI